MSRTSPAVALALLVALTGCATSPLPTGTPTPTPPAVTTPAAEPTPTPTPTPSAATSATPSASATPTTAAKRLATAALPKEVGGRRTDRVAESGGGQTASYYRELDLADILVAAVTPIGTAADAASRLSDPTTSGPLTCGTLRVGDKPTGACVFGLDRGFVLVNGSTGQSVADVRAFTQALYEALP